MLAPSGGPRGRTPRPGDSVEILRWPIDAGRRQQLLDERDLLARIQRLAVQSDGPVGHQPGEVAVDADGLLSFRDKRVVVPAIESTILNCMGEEPGRVASRTDLVAHIRPGDRKSERALDSRIHTLRTRIAPMGLTIHTIRGRGFLLAVEPDPPHEPVSRRAPSRRPEWSNS